MRIGGVATAAATIALLAVVAAWWAAPAVHGQSGGQSADGRRVRQIEVLGGRGSSIGVTVRDVDQADVDRYQLSNRRGVIVEHVDADGPASRAGVQAGDVIVEFDGEGVRSARQLARLVEETPAGREVRAAVVRAGARVVFDVTPGAGVMRLGSGLPDGGWFADRLRGLADLPSMPDLSELDRLPEWQSQLDRRLGRRTLGAGVQALTSDLATYFGAKNGVLVNAVRPESAAAAAGLEVGDVITSVNGKSVSSPSELRRHMLEAEEGELTLGIVRNKAPLSLKMPPDPPDKSARRRPGQPV